MKCPKCEFDFKLYQETIVLGKELSIFCPCCGYNCIDFTDKNNQAGAYYDAVFKILYIWDEDFGNSTYSRANNALILGSMTVRFSMEQKILSKSSFFVSRLYRLESHTGGNLISDYPFLHPKYIELVNGEPVILKKDEDITYKLRLAGLPDEETRKYSRESIKSTAKTAFLIWPNFISDNWKKYFVRFPYSSIADCIFILNDNTEKINEFSNLNSFPKFAGFYDKQDKSLGGVFSIKTPSISPLKELEPVQLAIDFGTSSTTVSYKTKNEDFDFLNKGGMKHLLSYSDLTIDVFSERNISPRASAVKAFCWLPSFDITDPVNKLPSEIIFIDDFNEQNLKEIIKNLKDEKFFEFLSIPSPRLYELVKAKQESQQSFRQISSGFKWKTTITPLLLSDYTEELKIAYLKMVFTIALAQISYKCEINAVEIVFSYPLAFRDAKDRFEKMEREIKQYIANMLGTDVTMISIKFVNESYCNIIDEYQYAHAVSDKSVFIADWGGGSLDIYYRSDENKDVVEFVDSLQIGGDDIIRIAGGSNFAQINEIKHAIASNQWEDVKPSFTTSKNSARIYDLINYVFAYNALTILAEILKRKLISKRSIKLILNGQAWGFIKLLDFDIDPKKTIHQIVTERSKAIINKFVENESFRAYFDPESLISSKIEFDFSPGEYDRKTCKFKVSLGALRSISEKSETEFTTGKQQFIGTNLKDTSSGALQYWFSKVGEVHLNEMNESKMTGANFKSLIPPFIKELQSNEVFFKHQKIINSCFYSQLKKEEETFIVTGNILNLILEDVVKKIILEA